MEEATVMVEGMAIRNAYGVDAGNLSKLYNEKRDGGRGGDLGDGLVVREKEVGEKMGWVAMVLRCQGDRGCGGDHGVVVAK